MALEPTISIVATFPPGFFLENIVYLPDETLVVTPANRRAIYALPPPVNHGSRSSFLLEQFADDQWTMGITHTPDNPHFLYLVVTDFIGTGSRKQYLRFMNINNIASGDKTTVLLEFPPEAKALNGLTAISNSTLLASDSFAGLIWRIDLAFDDNGLPTGGNITKWLEDPTMAGTLVLPDFQPGVNGLKYSAKTGNVLFSSTQQRLFAKVPVHPSTLEPIGPVTVLVRGPQGDDLIVDDDYKSGSVAYLTTHRDNSILRIAIDPPNFKSPADIKGTVTGIHEVVAEGSAESPLGLGPTSACWKHGCVGKEAYVQCDGGLKNPLPGEQPRFARILHVRFCD